MARGRPEIPRVNVHVEEGTVPDRPEQVTLLRFVFSQSLLAACRRGTVRALNPDVRVLTTRVSHEGVPPDREPFFPLPADCDFLLLALRLARIKMERGPGKGTDDARKCI